MGKIELLPQTAILEAQNPIPRWGYPADVEGITARIFDLTQLGGGPQGQLADAPVRYSLKARDIGHVFGATFDRGRTDVGAVVSFTGICRGSEAGAPVALVAIWSRRRTARAAPAAPGQ